MQTSRTNIASKACGAHPPRVIYVGPYLDEIIVRERGLRGHNAAGSNRMARIGRALAAAGLRPIILSPATSLQAKAAKGVMLPRRVHKTGPVAVVYATCVNIMGLNVLASVVTQFLTLRALIYREPLSGVIFYNSNAANILMAVYLRFFTRLRILHNVEDIYEPQFSDWTSGSGARPLQNLTFWVGQKLMGLMVDGYIVPTERFLARLATRPTACVITGCIDIKGAPPRTPIAPFRVLYAGKVEREHGIRHFIEALQILDGSGNPPIIEADISGTGDQSYFAAEAVKSLVNIKARFHGFVSKDAYSRLLADADICLALQDPAGRNAQLKTPSKVYEFIGYGKAVIATDVGDLAHLSPDVLKIMPTLGANELAALIERLSNDAKATARLQNAARNHAVNHYSYESVGEVIARMINPSD
jgi:glycosyltransferase involved in cell wall biosynthesis